MSQIANISEPPAATAPAVAVHLRYADSAGTTSKLGILHRHLKYISSSTTTINITVTPFGGASTSFSGSCSGSPITCLVNFTATPGPNTIAFSLTDGTNVLSRFSTVSVVQPNTLNTLNFTANPVVDSVNLSLANPTVNAGVAVDDALTINALDVDGNSIVGNAPYIDSNGDEVSFTLNVVDARAGGRGGTVIRGPIRISAPYQAPIYAHYDGNWLQNSKISVNSTSSAISNLSGVTLTTIPHVIEYSVAGGPYGILQASDGNIWFTERNSAKIGKIAKDGSGYAQYACGGCSAPYYLTMGPDGNIWFTQLGGNVVNKISFGGAVTPVINVGNYTVRIVMGPDGNIWCSEEAGHKFVRINTDGTYTSFGYPTGVRALAFDPTGNVWFTLYVTTTVGRRTITGKVLPSVTVPAVGNRSDGIIAGPDGNMWLANNNSDQIDSISPAGGVTIFNLSVGAKPYDIIAHNDGNLWFTESGALGRITTAGAITEFSTASLGATGALTNLAVGADGNIWFTEYGANKVGKFVL